MNLQKISKSHESVLLQGETGVGKSTLAKIIHEKSKRSNFLHLNIASLGGNLIESELFGHQKGSFSGAHSEKAGYLESVGNGTLFIDEIGELPLAYQVKLLTVMDEKIFYKVGSTNPQKFTGRFIFASNKNLADEVSKGTFRADLYFRIRFFEITKKPLRNEADLIKIILDKTYELSFIYERQIKYDANVLFKLSRHQWPGNYRELVQTLKYLFLLEKELIKIEDLPPWLGENTNNVEADLNNYHDALNIFEKNFFTKVMADNNGKINQTAERIGLSKVTLISKLKKYDIDRKVFQNIREKEIIYGI